MTTEAEPIQANSANSSELFEALNEFQRSGGTVR
ncbi:hypothetical protein PSYPI_23667, partial [Pseudomonas syringae pv. pisi str. 1704B]